MYTHCLCPSENADVYANCACKITVGRVIAYISACFGVHAWDLSLDGRGGTLRLASGPVRSRHKGPSSIQQQTPLAECGVHPAAGLATGVASPARSGTQPQPRPRFVRCAKLTSSHAALRAGTRLRNPARSQVPQSLLVNRVRDAGQPGRMLPPTRARDVGNVQAPYLQRNWCSWH